MKLRTQEEFDAHVATLPGVLAEISEDTLALHDSTKEKIAVFSKEREKLISRMERESRRLETRVAKLEARLLKFDAARPHIEDWNPHPVSPLRARTEQVLQDLQAHKRGLWEQIVALRGVSRLGYRPPYSPTVAEDTKAMLGTYRNLMGCENV